MPKSSKFCANYKVRGRTACRLQDGCSAKLSYTGRVTAGMLADGGRDVRIQDLTWGIVIAFLGG
jgi:hypothetical protein